MKEVDFVFECISIVDRITDDDVSVRTVGGGEVADPPFATMDRETNNVNDHGASPFAGTLRDEREYAVGKELHRSKQADVTWNIRANEEWRRDTIVEQIQDEFTKFAEDSSLFHEDTYQWEVDTSTPSSNPVVETDWYESALTIRCRFIKRVVLDREPIEEIQEEKHFI